MHGEGCCGGNGADTANAGTSGPDPADPKAEPDATTVAARVGETVVSDVERTIRIEGWGTTTTAVIVLFRLQLFFVFIYKKKKDIVIIYLFSYDLH